MDIKNILKWIWQLPQNICGIIWKLINKNHILVNISSAYYGLDIKVYLVSYGGGITLGKYIFINYSYKDITKVIRHECGHVKQSLLLGPMYILVIGIPSLIHACIYTIMRKYTNLKWDYYSFYTEKWANNLMKLK